nr:16S rRNA (guanine(527)-N(7))-methyltransferase RsmG [Sansalvadorimonas sp. 2012CJ34-2]
MEVMLQLGAEQMGINLSPEQLARLHRYVELLAKWNKVYNLTAVRDPKEMVSRHILDSLSILSHVERLTNPGSRFIDVGSGPGLPGIPLAIMLPDRDVSTLDCVGKKTRFQQQVCAELDITNVTVLNERVEKWQPEQPYDLVMSRAFSSFSDMIKGTDHFLKSDGLWLAMKGIHPDVELKELKSFRPDISAKESYSLTVAGCEGQRHLVILERMDRTQAV